MSEKSSRWYKIPRFVKRRLRQLLFRQIDAILSDVPREGRNDYELRQLRTFNKILFYLPFLALLSTVLTGFHSNFAERAAIVVAFAVGCWVLILFNKKGYDFVARPLFVAFVCLISAYIHYRESHHLNTYIVLFLISPLGLAIAPRHAKAEKIFAISFPLLTLLVILFVDIPFIPSIQRPAEEIKLYSNVTTLVYFILFTYAAWLLVEFNKHTYENLLHKIELNRRTQQKLLKREEELRIAQKIAGIGFWEFTAEGKPRWSRETYEILHVPVGATIDEQLISSIVHPEDLEFVLENLLRGIKEGGKYTFDFRLHPHLGERWISVHCTESVPVPGKKFFQSKGIVKDITTSKQTERQLLQAIAEKDRIIAMVSHDLKNPVASTLQLLDLAAIEIRKHNYGESQKILLQYQEMMRYSQERTIEIINDLMELCARRQVVQLSGKPTDLHALVEQTITPQIYRASKKGILLQLKPATSEIIVNIVPDKIARSVENLVVNAIKFTPIGGKITVSVEKSGDFALIAVADTGIGVPDELKKYLFEQFGKARRLGTEGESSTGLGLSIVKQWVEMHNGNVWCEDNQPQGSIFYISLPLLKENTSPAWKTTAPLVPTF